VYIIRSKRYKSLAFTDQQNRFHSIHQLPLTFTQLPTRETFLSQTTYIARNHKLAFLQNVHKTSDSYCDLTSLEFLCSSLAKYQAQWKVLASSQALLTSRTPHSYVFTRVPIFCLLIVSKDQLIILPKLPSSPKSELWIFLTTCPSFTLSSPLSLTFYSLPSLPHHPFPPCPSFTPRLPRASNYSLDFH
jgi:hypothetical protein